MGILNNFYSTLRRYKISSVLNIFGLGVAFASLYLIMVQVNHDYFFNSSIKDSERVFEMQIKSTMSEDKKFATNVCRPLANAILKDAPEIEAFGSIIKDESANYVLNKNTDNSKSVTLTTAKISDSALDVLGIEAIQGSFDDFLQNTDSKILMSESTATELNLSVGDDIYIPGNSKFYQIAAIYADIARNNNFEGCKVITHIGDNGVDDFSQWSYTYYVKFFESSLGEKSRVNQAAVDRGFDRVIDFFIKMSGGTREDIIKEIGDAMFRFEPITDTYYGDELSASRKGNKSTTITLFTIAVVIIVIAFINFINFFFALVPIRIKAVNAHKIFGCSRRALMLNFIAESLGLVFCSLAVAAVIALVVQDSFMLGYFSASILFSDNFALIVSIVLCATITGIVVATYPAYYITSFPASMVVRGGFSSSKSGQMLRYSLVGIQFVASITLLIYTIFAQLQYNYMLNYDMGVNKTNLLSTPLPETLTQDIANRDNFTQRLKENNQILDVGFGYVQFVGSTVGMTWGRDHKDGQILFDVYPASYNFIKFMGLEIAEGRDFVSADESLEAGTFIFNQTAAKKFDINIGDKIGGAGTRAEVVGIVKDFNFRSLSNNIQPFAFYIFGTKESNWSKPNEAYFRLAPDADIKEVINHIKSTTEQFSKDFSSRYMEFKFFDEQLGEMYTTEQRYSTLILIFALVSIIISLMGIFGLVLFETQFRQREIVIRKVHGATVKDILWMINQKFMRIVLICFAAAAPISYYIIDKWLSGFAYRIPMHIWVFAIVLILIAAIVLTVVTVRSYNAANQNPSNVISKNN